MDAHPDHIFLKLPDGTGFSFGDVIRAGRALKNKIEPGNSRPVAVQSNHKRAPVIIAACWSAGIPFWMIPPDLNTENLSDSQQKMLESHLGHIKPAAMLGESQNDLLKLLPKIDFDLESEDSESENPPPSPDSVFCWITTSGTSGDPKILVLRRSQMIHAAKASALNFRPDPGESWLLSLPLHHIGGISVVLRSWIYGSSVEVARPDDYARIKNILKGKESCVIVSLVPTQILKLLEDKSFHPHKNFKAILTGGGPAAKILIENARSRNIPVIRSYGMSETCAQITAVKFSEEETVDPECSGSVLSGNEIQIRDDENRRVKSGETGLIWLKGPQVISEYVHPAESGFFDENGWFCSGDYGRLDTEERLFVEMRREDRIVSGGENVSPEEIESLLESLNEISRAAVIGVENPKWGQAVIAFIEKTESQKPGDSEFWRILIREKLQLPPFKVPYRVFVLEKIPQTELGKIKKGELRKLAADKMRGLR